MKKQTAASATPDKAALLNVIHSEATKSTINLDRIHSCLTNITPNKNMLKRRINILHQRCSNNTTI